LRIRLYQEFASSLRSSAIEPPAQSNLKDQTESAGMSQNKGLLISKSSLPQEWAGENVLLEVEVAEGSR